MQWLKLIISPPPIFLLGLGALIFRGLDIARHELGRLSKHTQQRICKNNLTPFKSNFFSHSLQTSTAKIMYLYRASCFVVDIITRALFAVLVD